MSWYFKNGILFPQGQPITQCKRYMRLPYHKPIIVTPSNLYAYSKIIPVSMLASDIQGEPFKFTFNNEIGFYDLETDKKGEIFKLGVINNKPYYTPETMIKDLHSYKVRVAYNLFRFDNVVLYHNLETPNNYMGTYKLGKYTLYYIKDGINLDLLFFTRLYGFTNLRLYAIAKKLDYQYNRFKDFNLDKCTQDVDILQHLFMSLNIPEFCNILNDYLNVDLNILQNVFFDKFLRYILLTEYLKQGYLPLIYPQKPQYFSELPQNLLKYANQGEYKNIFYYDVQNAYPTTAYNLKQGIYQGEHVISILLKKLTDTTNRVTPETRKPIKRLANALIGYMNDRTNYFSNPSVWFNVVTNFNNYMVNLLSKYQINIIWGNIDGFMTQEKINLEETQYKINLKQFFTYIKIFSPNKYLGITPEYKIHMKGFNSTKLEGLTLIEKQLRVLLSQSKNVTQAFKKLKVQDILNDKNLWQLTIRKTSETCHNLAYLKYWENLDFGFTDITLTKKERKEEYAKWKKQFI